MAHSGTRNATVRVFESHKAGKGRVQNREASADYIFHLYFSISHLDSNTTPLGCVFGARLAPAVVNLFRAWLDLLLQRSADYIFQRR